MRDTIDMAREAGMDVAELTSGWGPIITAEPADLERFEALVRADERNRTWTQEHWTEYERSIAAAERELIAQSMDKQAELAADDIDRQWAQEMAAAIRAKGNT